MEFAKTSAEIQNQLTNWKEGDSDNRAGVLFLFEKSGAKFSMSLQGERYLILYSLLGAMHENKNFRKVVKEAVEIDGNPLAMALFMVQNGFLNDEEVQKLKKKANNELLNKIIDTFKTNGN